MAQTQAVTNTGPLIPLGFCRVLADVIRRILKDQENGTAQTSEPITSSERTGEEEPPQ